MYNPVDMFGQELMAGSIIIYSVKHSSSVSSTIAVVQEVIDNGEEYRRGRYQLKVVSFAPYGKFDYTQGKYVQGVYKTKLTSNDTIIKISPQSVPVLVAQVFKDASVV